MMNLIQELIKNKEFNELEKYLLAQININQNDKKLWKLLGDTFAVLHKESINAYKRSYLLNSQIDDYDYEIDNSYAVELIKKNKLNEAINILENIISKNIKDSKVHANLAWVYKLSGKESSAIDSYNEAIKISPKNAKYHCNLGVIYLDKGNLLRSEEEFNIARNLDPDLAENWVNLSNLYDKINRPIDSINACVEALKRNPKIYEAHNNLGNALKKLNNFFGAIQSFRNALNVKSDATIVMSNLAELLGNIGELEEATQLCLKALKVNPESKDSNAMLLFNINYDPTLSIDQIFSYYRRFGKMHEGGKIKRPKFSYDNSKIRIGYVSADFRMHSMYFFLYPLISSHNKEEFELFAFAEQSNEDDITLEYKKHFAGWINTFGMTDDEMALSIKNNHIDILVDCSGHTTGNRLTVFTKKPAPVSVTAWGYGYTTGLKSIDYFLASEKWLSTTDQKYFTEKIWRLKGPHLSYSPHNKLKPYEQLPAIQNGYVTFATLSRGIRINNDMVRIWSRLLNAVPGSKLRIDSGHFQSEKMQKYFKDKFLKNGIDEERLIIGFTQPVSEIYKEIDIVLDTAPHNSGTTLIDALYCGVPFITIKNRPAVGHIGKYILSIASMEDWIANNEDEYINIGIKKAKNLAGLANVRRKLIENFPKSKFFNGTVVKEIEESYKEMLKISKRK